MHEDAKSFPEHYVFKGEVRSRMIAAGALKEKKRSVAYVYATAGRLIVALYLLDEKNESQGALRAVQLPTADGCDLVGAYRAFRLLEAMQSVSDQNFIGALLLPHEHLYLDNRALPVLREDILKQFDEKALAAHLQALPENLVERFTFARDELGVVFQTSFLTDEVEANRLEYSDQLKGIGVEHPNTRKERIAAAESLRAIVRPHIRTYLGFEERALARAGQGTAAEITDDDCQLFEKGAVLAYAKGLAPEIPMMVGTGLLFGMVLSEDISLVCPKFPYVRISNFYRGRDHETYVMNVARFMFATFPGMPDVTKIASDLRAAMRQWDSVPADPTKY